MSNMRQRILSMTRRVQERPCWLQDDVVLDPTIDETIEQLVSVLRISDQSDRVSQQKSTSMINDIDVEESIYRETSIANVGHFKYFSAGHVQIRFSNGFILHMTAEQVHACQVRRRPIATLAPLSSLPSDESTC